MVLPCNVIIFGDRTIDRRFVLKLAGAVNADDPSPTGIFETKKHPVTISKQEYKLYDTAGLTDADGDNLRLDKARQALGNLYRLTHMLDGDRVHLLIYVASAQPSSKNLKLFHDYLCRKNVPMILVTINHDPPSMPHGFPLPVITLTLDDASPKNEDKLRGAIISQVTSKESRRLDAMERFKLTTADSWTLFERESGWSLTECRKALEATFVENTEFSKGEVQTKCKEITEYIKKYYFCNVIVFGDTGAGKTSVIAMLTDKCKMDVKASSAGGSTRTNKSYDFDIEKYHYRFHDTVGLDDQTADSMSPEEALRNLYQLILKVDGGVSLLVYVHRDKIKPSQVFNYKVFSHVICNNKVPTALVVTGLEEKDLETDDWWEANKHLYTGQGIDIKYHACITSTKGKLDKEKKEFKYQSEYNLSKEKLKTLFRTTALEEPWKIEKTMSFWRSLVMEVYDFFATRFKWGSLATDQSLHKRLMAIVGMEDDKAMSLANTLEGAVDSKELNSDSTSTLNAKDGIKGPQWRQWIQKLKNSTEHALPSEVRGRPKTRWYR